MRSLVNWTFSLLNLRPIFTVRRALRSVITDRRALLFIMWPIWANRSINSRLTRLVDLLLPFHFSIDDRPGSKMGLVDYILQEPQKKAVNMSTYVKQFIVAKLDAVNSSAKRFLLNFKTYTDFAERNVALESYINKLNTSDKLCSEFGLRIWNVAKARTFKN